MPEPVVTVSGLSKKFARSLRKTMWYGLCDIGRAALVPQRFRSAQWSARLADTEKSAPSSAGTPAPGANGEGLRATEFWALKDVSFTLAPGECVGVVGANGAGKSTLFSILSGIYGPSEGRVEIRGALQALIALGAGFHPMLSGRENIYINAAVFGLTAREIDRLVDGIVEFAEVGPFIDAPVRTYSSGMLVRLGFSVAAHLEPDILLVDEVLAVGDSKFQAKCQEFTRRLWNSGKAIMVVSHYMQNIQGMCTRAIWLEKGRAMMDGDVQEVTNAYQRHLFSSGTIGNDRGREATGGFSACIESVHVLDAQGRALDQIDPERPVLVEVVLMAAEAFDCGRFYICLTTLDGRETILSANMLEDGTGVPLRAGKNVIAAQFQHLPVNEGVFRFYACVRNRDGVAALSNGQLSQPFHVARKALKTPAQGGLPLVTGVASGHCVAPYTWRFREESVFPDDGTR